MCSMGLWWHTPTVLVWQYPPPGGRVKFFAHDLAHTAHTRTEISSKLLNLRVGDLLPHFKIRDDVVRSVHRSWWGGHRFVGDLVAKWPHLFVIKFVYWWWNVCILCITYS